MPPPTRRLIRQFCECGGTMQQKKHGFFHVRWRFECFCGRCGPWKWGPAIEDAAAAAFAEAHPASSPKNLQAEGTPPPQKK